MGLSADEPVVGVHIASGVIYLGTVRCPNELVLDEDVRLKPGEHLEEAVAFRQFADRVRGELQRLRPRVVGVTHPRRPANWKYRDAFTRVASEVAVMVAAAEENVPYRSVVLERMAKAISVPLDPRDAFPTRLAKELEISAPPLWSDRAYAFGAALALAKEAC